MGAGLGWWILGGGLELGWGCEDGRRMRECVEKGRKGVIVVEQVSGARRMERGNKDAGPDSPSCERAGGKSRDARKSRAE